MADLSFRSHAPGSPRPPLRPDALCPPLGALNRVQRRTRRSPMRVCVTSEHRFRQTPDGRVWTVTNHAYSDWLEYLDVFDEVRVAARIEQVEAPSSSWLRADG